MKLGTTQVRLVRIADSEWILLRKGRIDALTQEAQNGHVTIFVERLLVLREETLRYSELRRRLPKITHKMLSQQLRELEADGLVNRTVYPVVPPKTEYALTEEGRTLRPMLTAMQQWGLRYKRIESTPSAEGAEA